MFALDCCYLPLDKVHLPQEKEWAHCLFSSESPQNPTSFNQLQDSTMPLVAAISVFAENATSCPDFLEVLLDFVSSTSSRRMGLQCFVIGSILISPSLARALLLYTLYVCFLDGITAIPCGHTFPIDVWGAFTYCHSGTELLGNFPLQYTL